MATVSKETASQVMAVDGYEGRTQDLGGYTVAYETFTSDQDPAPLFVGLPDDHCQCPHWGTVVKGALTYRYTDGTRIVELSMKCLPDEAFQVAAEARAFFHERGIDTTAPQQMKTKSAIEFFSKELADRS